MCGDKDGNLDNISEYTSLYIKERYSYKKIREMSQEERQRAKEREEMNRCSQ